MAPSTEIRRACARARRQSFPLFLVAWVLAWPAPGLSVPIAAAEEPIGSYKPKPWDNLGGNMVRSVFGWPMALHASAASATWFLYDRGADAAGLRIASRQDPLWNGLSTGPGLLASSFAPIVLPASLYFFSDRWTATGAVAMQSVGIAFLYNNVLKAATGRRPPESDHPDPEALARGFRFGFLRGGVFNGWPSGHAMTNAALASGIASYHRDSPWAAPSALAYSAYVGTCVVLGARGDIHWVSEGVAGVLMGLGIGWTVGEGYRRDRAGKSADPGISFFPVIGEAVGLRAAARLGGRPR